MQINGSALKVIRERSGLSQSELSRQTGKVVSQGRISEIEKTEQMTVQPSTALALAQALVVPVTSIAVLDPAAA